MSRKPIKPAKEINEAIASFNMVKTIRKEDGTKATVKADDNADATGTVPENKKTKETESQSGKAAEAKPEKTADKSRQPKKTLSKDLTERMTDNFMRYDRTADKGMAIFIPTELNAQLRQMSDEHYKRLSARTIASAILATVLNTYDINAVIDNFFEKIHYDIPTEEQLEERKRSTERIRKYRENNNNK